jgi:predicted RNase H-like nuclease (RuvC/YqgF family)
MQDMGSMLLMAALSVVVTLVVTLIFNKLIALPQAIKKHKAAEQAAEAAKVAAEQKYKEEIDARLKRVEAAVDALPSYREQSFKIQAELKAEQSEIVKLCKAMNNTIESMDARLIRTQKQANEREMNDLRQKLINEYRLFTSPVKNPMKAWSEMEYKAFMSQVKDYESLGGNDYIHKTVLPAINDLEIVSMDDEDRLAEMMNSRQL